MVPPATSCIILEIFEDGRSMSFTLQDVRQCETPAMHARIGMNDASQLKLLIIYDHVMLWQTGIHLMRE